MNPSTTTPMPKLVRLENEIKTETDPVKKGCLRAERAGLLARQGSFDLAREALNALQRDFGRNPQASVSIWMQIAEGWMAHYDDRPDAANDHFKRAYALSCALELSDLKSLSAAWLAHLAFSKNQFVEMTSNLQHAIDSLPPDFHYAQARLSMVLAMSFHFARRLDLAVPWYKICRKSALIEGDDSTLSSLSFNMAGLQGNHAIQAAVFGGHIKEFSGLALTGADSSYSFDKLVKISSRDKWVYMLKAYTTSAQENFAEANRLYEEHLDDACLQGLQHQRAFFVADRAWCRIQLQDFGGAQRDVEEAALLVSDDMYVEDRAVACGRLAQALTALGQRDLAAKFQEQAFQDWANHETARENLLTLLKSLDTTSLLAAQI